MVSYAVLLGDKRAVGLFDSGGQLEVLSGSKTRGNGVMGQKGSGTVLSVKQ